ncbi:MAG: CarD family transcriptional regulator [Alphaproteobacteria bacterium]|nr:CarD family transcriptional regulator [Alphaproteobacteria bacterium]
MNKMVFKVGDHVVYPTHGVGVITGEETQKIGGVEIRVFVIAFTRDKMILRVPVTRAQIAGLRHVSGDEDITKVISTLKGKAKTKRGMWSRRAQEYEAKINSGNILSLAEVVRDLHKNVDQPDRSYSERMIYESALGRLVGEFAASKKIDQQKATEELLVVLKQVAA